MGTGCGFGAGCEWSGSGVWPCSSALYKSPVVICRGLAHKCIVDGHCTDCETVAVSLLLLLLLLLSCVASAASEPGDQAEC